MNINFNKIAKNLQPIIDNDAIEYNENEICIFLGTHCISASIEDDEVNINVENQDNATSAFDHDFKNDLGWNTTPTDAVEKMLIALISIYN